MLKGLIRQPRPKEDLHVFTEIKNKKRYGFDVYGFPSGHAQLAFYSLGFLSNALKREKHFLPILFVFISISLITLYQRFAFKNHTAIQLVAGSLIGFLVGYITYYLAKRNIAGSMKRKRDDDAFAA
jgi:membrane-associated phospholipid phosphatase